MLCGFVSGTAQVHGSFDTHANIYQDVRFINIVTLSCMQPELINYMHI